MAEAGLVNTGTKAVGGPGGMRAVGFLCFLIGLVFNPLSATPCQPNLESWLLKHLSVTPAYSKDNSANQV